VRLHIGGFEKFPSFLLVALHFTKLTRRRLSEKKKKTSFIHRTFGIEFQIQQI
jgi:hypothetical protein